MDVLWHGVRDTLLMAWQVLWPLALGFTISAAVQAWGPRERVQRALGGSGLRPVGLATALGAASSSCSYAAVAIARSIFEKGASAASALAFQLASTNLVIELGIVMWVLLGWQFTLAEFLGGLVMIALMTLLLRVTVSRTVERRAREHAVQAGGGGAHHHHGHRGGCAHGDDATADPAGSDERVGAGRGAGRATLRRLVASRAAWSQVAMNLRHDVRMLWKEISFGLVLAGFIAQIHPTVIRGLFLPRAPAALQALESAVLGPLLAAASFVCSIGNVPLAAVLWSDGMAFAGVIAFLFADLLVLPIVLIYRKYYGAQFAWRIVALMYTAMVLAALAVDGLFSGAGLIPRHRPSPATVFPSVSVDFQLFANIAAALLVGALLFLRRVPRMRRTARAPVQPASLADVRASAEELPPDAAR